MEVGAGVGPTSRSRPTSRPRSRSGLTSTATATPLTALLLGLVLVLVLPPAHASHNGTRSCGPFVHTNGYMVPQGDIIIREGTPLEILCVLSKPLVEGHLHNASDLRLYHGKTLLGPEHVSIVNETTVRYYVEKAPAMMAYFYCKLKVRPTALKVRPTVRPTVRTTELNTTSEEIPEEVPVCFNTVMVGYEPQGVDNFKCISHNWRSMNCSWVPKYNPVPTKYRIFFQVRTHDTSAYKCPNHTDERDNMCEWADDTDPMYRQTAQVYKFTLRGENALNNTTFSYEWDHFSHILPAPPTNLEALNVTSNSFLLKWIIPFPMNTWSRSYTNLHHKIAYAYQGKGEPFVTAFEGLPNCPQRSFEERPFDDYACFYNLTGLEYAHYLYDIRVFIKTENASDAFYSPPAFLVKRTAPALPPKPPSTDVGSFEVAYHLPSKDVTLYWQTLPENLYSGANFDYRIVEVLKNNKRVEISRMDPIGKKKSVVFRNLTVDDYYTFRIASFNEMGECPETSVITVPPKTYTDHLEPESLTKTSMGNGDFKLTWSGPRKSTALITNYTIFWCDSSNDRPETCSGFLNWTHVDKDARELTVSLKPMMYHFAIAANSEKASSGMVWASCSMNKDKVDKLKTVHVTIRDSATSLVVDWQLHCTDADNVVKGFIIFYCVAFGDCPGEPQNMTISGNHTLKSATLQGLQPYSTYRISVAIMIEGGHSLPSDPVYQTTKEAAPSTPPMNVTVNAVTNSSVRISWVPPPNPNGVIRHYEIFYNGDSKKHLIDTSKYPEVLVEDTIENLSSYTKYSFAVKACTSKCSDASQPVIAHTLIGTPGEVLNAKVQYVNSSQVLVSWDSPVVRGGNIDQYIVTMDVKYEDDSHDPLKKYVVKGNLGNSSELYVTIPDCELVRNVFITFAIRAVNLDGDRVFLGKAVEVPTGTCFTGEALLNLVLMAVGGVVAAILFVGAFIYYSRMCVRRCREMRDLTVKLPAGMVPEDDTKDNEFTKTSWITRHPDNDDSSSNTRPAAEADTEKLLQGKDDRNGESSGRGSSGPDTVSTSTNSGTHISSDSGTGMDQNEQGFPESGKWAAAAAAAAANPAGDKKSKLESEWEAPPYVHVGNPVSAEVADQTKPLYPNVEPAAWLQTCEGYVTMTGKEGTFGPQVHDVMAMTSPTKPPRGYVAHNAPVPGPASKPATVVAWSKPLLSDGYVQTGFKSPDVAEDKEDFVVGSGSECAEEAVPIVRPNGSVSPSVVGMGSKVLRGDECERTSVEVPLVANRTPNGYVAHPAMAAMQPGAPAPQVKPVPVPVPQAKPAPMSAPASAPAMRHEYVRTAEKNPSSAAAFVDSGKPYTRLGERDPATRVGLGVGVGMTLSEVLGKPMGPALVATPAPAPAPALTAPVLTATPAQTSTTSGYVPHIQFENRGTPGVVRE